MIISPAEIEETLHLLAETPHRIAALSHGLADGCLQNKSGEESWSVNDILAHLRACADIWGKSIITMMQQDHPTLRYVSPRTWMKKTNYSERAFHESFAAFVKQREELLQVLQSLPGEAWARGATFTGTTRGREPTILSYAQRLARHESEHCEQIETLLK